MLSGNFGLKPKFCLSEITSLFGLTLYLGGDWNCETWQCGTRSNKGVRARLNRRGPSRVVLEIRYLTPGGQSPVIIKFPDFSLTFPHISSEYLRNIDPRNSSNIKRNACYFSLQYSYILSQLWQLCSSVDSNGI